MSAEAPETAQAETAAGAAGGQQKSALEFDWTERIEAASSDATTLHHLAQAWSEVATTEGRALSEGIARLSELREKSIDALRTGKQSIARLVGTGHQVGGSRLLRRLQRGRLAQVQTADTKLRTDYRAAYAGIEAAIQKAVGEAHAWQGHLDRWGAQGHDLLDRLGAGDPARANVDEALQVLQTTHQRLEEYLARLEEPIPEWLRP